jgi:hypothetical protein
MAGALVCGALVAAPAARATITVGQLPPSTSGPAMCTMGPRDLVQPSITSGVGYFVPGNGTIVSWSHRAALGLGQQLEFKVFRKVGNPATFQVVGHDGPLSLSGGVVNTFATAIPVRSGDVIGLNDANATVVPNACVFSVPGESVRFRAGDLSDGQVGDFGSEQADVRLNVAAVLQPTNSFTFGGVVRDKSSGTARLTVNVPNAGIVSIAGRDVAAKAGAKSSRSVSYAGGVQMTVKAKGKARKKLARTGKAKVNPRVTFIPTGGDSLTLGTKVKLVKKR